MKFRLFLALTLMPQLLNAVSVEDERAVVFERLVVLQNGGDVSGKIFPVSETKIIRVIVNDFGNDGSDALAHIYALAGDNTKSDFHAMNLWGNRERANALRCIAREMNQDPEHICVEHQNFEGGPTDNDYAKGMLRVAFLGGFSAWPSHAFGIPFQKNPSLKEVSDSTSQDDYQGFYGGYVEAYQDVFGDEFQNGQAPNLTTSLMMLDSQDYLIDLILLSPFAGVGSFVDRFKDKIRSVVIQGGPVSAPFPEQVRWGYNTAVSPKLTREVFDTLVQERIPTLIMSSYACDLCLMPEADLDEMLTSEKMTKIGRAVQLGWHYWNKHMSIKGGKPHKDNKLSDVVVMAALDHAEHLGEIKRGSVHVDPGKTDNMLSDKASELFTSSENENGVFFFVNGFQGPDTLYKHIKDRIDPVLFAKDTD